MKRFLLLFFLFAIPSITMAQSLSVASFNELPNDLDARANYPKSNPSEADVYLTTNGVESLVGTTPFRQKLAYGDYRFRLSKPLYHDEVGIAQINQGKVEFAPTLSPAHGRIRVTSSPSGAKVSIDGVAETYTTPCTTAVLASGEYQLRVSKEKYSPAQKTIVVQDGKVVDVNFDLAANFAKITINSLSGADIYVNGNKKATTSFIDDFTPGIYDVEARKESHRTVRKQIEVEANKPQPLFLNPTPIYGSLDVISDPMEATVTINGKDYGKTPTTIDNLLIGQYQVVLTKEGYGSETATVTIEEGKTAELNRRLSNGRELTFTTTPTGADLYVDGKRMGTTPATLTLTYGSHSIKVKNSESEKTDNISVSATMSKTRYSYILIKLNAENLVYNPSFEEYRDCPRKIDALGTLTIVDGWWQPTKDSPDYFNVCGSKDCGVPKNKLGVQSPRTGNGYCGIYCSKTDYREYLQTRLKKTLEAGRKYRLSLYVSLSEYSPNMVASIGGLFTRDRISDTIWSVLKDKQVRRFAGGHMSQTIVTSYQPQVVNPTDRVLGDTENWILISGEFVAEGGERFLTIGNFNSADNSNLVEIPGDHPLPGAYYYIEDVSVICIDCIVE